MIDIKSFTNWRGTRGQAKGIIHSEKWENHKNSTHTEIKFYIIYLIFFLQWILKILQIGGGGKGAGEIYFFDIFLYYIINVIIKMLYISSFCCCLSYIFYTVHIDGFSPSPEKLTFCCKKSNVSKSFWPRWLTHASFCREFSCQ